LVRPGGAASALAAPTPVATEGVCELCAASLAARHRHLLELDIDRLRCACTPCALLFDRGKAGPWRRGVGGAALGRYRLVPERIRRVVDFRLDDERWSDLAIPVGLAYLVWSSRQQRVRAFYPGALGAVESSLGLDAWTRIAGENPILGSIEADVEALLVRRLPAIEDCWLVSLDACFELVAILRTRWRGLTGGERVWGDVEGFFDRLGGRAHEVDRAGNGIDRRKKGTP
jgi:hypothetical protein